MPFSALHVSTNMYSIASWLLAKIMCRLFFDSLNTTGINHTSMGDTVRTDVLIVGAGPSGYVALPASSFRSETK